jgi:hypothetical protein
MFSIPRPNIIASTDGFSVEVLGKTGILYTEGENTVRIDSEVLAGPSGLVIYTDSIRAWSGPGRALLGQFERERIIANVKAAFEFRGYDIEIN